MGLGSRTSIVALAVFVCTPAWAQDIEGVHVPDAVLLDGTRLVLNGAGVRRHYFFDVYVAALYLTRQADTPEAAMAAPMPKRIRLHLLRDVAAEDMVNESLERFRANASETAYAQLCDRVEAFRSAFPDLRAGDEASVDLVPEGTEIWVNGWLLTEIPGEDFQEAVLKVWLGDGAADQRLKQAMLGRW
ncbi:lipoprotein transmembrane [Sulfurifustis variabilis]|uniref:Lipoprotein transmembrane n=1 Tax=Sulfurifustis variabilis TaxID=1675686 RepID=A0A1B4VB05_9GAMM|nr:lipoprotein transmembrane [Sulfurifustis variabilis]